MGWELSGLVYHRSDRWVHRRHRAGTCCLLGFFVVAVTTTFGLLVARAFANQWRCALPTHLKVENGRTKSSMEPMSTFINKQGREVLSLTGQVGLMSSQLSRHSEWYACLHSISLAWSSSSMPARHMVHVGSICAAKCSVSEYFWFGMVEIRLGPRRNLKQ